MGLYSFDQSYRSQGYETLAGVDEVGRGCLAGPVFAAAVILPPELRFSGLDDSKKITAPQREVLDGQIRERALAFSIAMVSAPEIDHINILRASLLAMRLAVGALSLAPALTLVDGNQKFAEDPPQVPVVAGDGKSASVAAASIIAKVARDAFMTEQEGLFPQFSFSRHKGYGTEAHLRELRKFGPSPLHRRSFEPVRQLSLNSFFSFL